MAAKQGYNRLTQGARKTITDSEVNRGYFYITNDKLVLKELGENFEVKFVDRVLKDRKIDSYGRVSISRLILRRYRGKEFSLRMANRKIIIDLVK